MIFKHDGAERRAMRKQTIQYSSPVDALIAVSKRLSLYENRHEMEPETFFDRYTRGELGDAVDFVEWANDYRHYIAMKADVEMV
jgi:hypothetical protein